MCTAPFRLQSYAVSCLRARGYPGVTLLPPRHHCWYTAGCAAVVAKTLSIFRFSPTSVRGCGLPEGGVGRRGRRRAAPPGCRAGAAAPLPRLCPAMGGAAPAGCAVFHLSLRGGWQRELRLGLKLRSCWLPHPHGRASVGRTGDGPGQKRLPARCNGQFGENKLKKNG